MYTMPMCSRHFAELAMARTVQTTSKVVLPPRPVNSQERLTAERAVLGMLLYDNTILATLGGLVEKRDFLEPGHSALFSAIRSAVTAGRLADSITIWQAMQRDRALSERGGVRYLADLVNQAPSRSSIWTHLLLLLDAAPSEDAPEVPAQDAAQALHIEQLLGGEAVVGKLRSAMDVVALVRRGIPTRAVHHFADRHLPDFGVIDRSVLPRRTFKRRVDANQPLDPMESDRLLRLVGLVASAEDTFGGSAKALAWLSRPTKALHGQTPISLSDTDHGARSVETLLGKIAHGIAA